MTDQIDTKLLTTKQTSAAIKQLIESCKEMSWAVAWATKNALLDQVFNHPDKIKMLAFGISFSQTDPDVLARLIGRSGCGFIHAPSNETFHPKVYLFEHGRSSTAIIGSSNFTNGGLVRNTELCVQLSGSSENPVFLELREQLDAWQSQIKPVSADFVDRYRVSYLASRKRMPSPKPNIWFGNGDSVPPLMSMNWSEFVECVHQERVAGHDPYRERMLVLTHAQNYFSSTDSFGDLSENHRKAIAGTFRPANEMDKAKKETGIRNWGWFGGMSGNGTFSSAICEKASREAHPNLVAALDRIPIQGNIESSDFDAFVSEIKTNVPGNLDIGTLTRLLAIKRPDTFICVCSGNQSRLADGLGIKVSKLKELDGYWQNVIERFRNSSWYNTRRPSGENGRLWDWRAAMADAVYYGK
jgi:HKD family nuclease